MKLLFVVFTVAVLAMTMETNGEGINLPKEIVELLRNLSKVCEDETGVSEGKKFFFFFLHTFNYFSRI